MSKSPFEQPAAFFRKAQAVLLLSTPDTFYFSSLPASWDIYYLIIFSIAVIPCTFHYRVHILKVIHIGN